MCSSFLPRLERFDARVSVQNGDFNFLGKNPESGQVIVLINFRLRPTALEVTKKCR